MGAFPDYACSCCGYTNGDMFYDRDVEITEQVNLLMPVIKKHIKRHVRAITTVRGK